MNHSWINQSSAGDTPIAVSTAALPHRSAALTVAILVATVTSSTSGDGCLITPTVLALLTIGLLLSAAESSWNDEAAEVSSSDPHGSDEEIITNSAILALLVIEFILFESAAISFPLYLPSTSAPSLLDNFLKYILLKVYLPNWNFNKIYKLSVLSEKCYIFKPWI